MAAKQKAYILKANSVLCYRDTQLLETAWLVYV